MREIIKEARSVEEAIDLACQELGVERDVIEFEIISLPKRGFLGLKHFPAKVRVCVEEPEKAVPVAPPATKKAVPAERSQKMEKPVKTESKPVKQETRQEQKPKPAPKPVQRDAAKPQEAVQKSTKEVSFVSADTVDGKARAAADYVKSVLADIGVEAVITVATTDNGIVLRLSGDGLGVIIGRRGETLDSLQYLAGLVANRQEGDYMRVTIDSGNYREKRERTLEQLAQKIASSAIRHGRSSTLEPMNPYERRIIHSTVSKIEGVTSSSVGEEPNRRVVITPDNARPQQNRGNRGGRGNSRDSRPPRRNDSRPGESRYGDRPRRDNRDRTAAPRDKQTENVRPTSTDIDREYAKALEREVPSFSKPQPAEKPVEREKTAPQRVQTPKEGDDLPLYGKIEL